MGGYSQLAGIHSNKRENAAVQTQQSDPVTGYTLYYILTKLKKEFFLCQSGLMDFAEV